jgi:hypothetical protein
MPVWSRLDGDGRASAARDARASLAARRLLDPGARSRDELRRDLRSVVVLRETATAVVAVARSTSHGRDHWYAHVTGGVVLLEQVSLDGRHRFALTAAATLPTLVVAAVLHPAAGAASTPTPDQQTEWLRADVELRDGRRAWRSSWVSGPGGTWQGADGGQPARPVPPDEAAGLLTSLLTSVVTPLVEGGADGDG